LIEEERILGRKAVWFLGYRCQQQRPLKGNQWQKGIELLKLLSIDVLEGLFSELYQFVSITEG
jgi:hypothetical protein